MAGPSSTSKLMLRIPFRRTVFEDEELDDDFAPNLRQPITEKPITRNTRGAAGRSRASSYFALADGDSEDSDDDYLTNQLSKKIRLPGGTAATPKRVGTELDSDDEVLRMMKEAGIKDEDVAAEISARGGPKYHPKTIATRYSRIKRMLQKLKDDNLDDELTDWHEGEDEMLEDSIASATAALAAEYRTLEMRKWIHVQESMHHHIGKSKYSTRACSERWTDLQNGTAEPPFEQDPDPAARTARTLARLEARRIDRAEEAEANHEKLEAKKAKRAANKLKEKEILEKREANAVGQNKKREEKAAAKAERQAQKDAKKNGKKERVANTQAKRKHAAEERVNNERLKVLKKKQMQDKKVMSKQEIAAEKAIAEVQAAKELLEAKAAKLVRIKTEACSKALIYKYMGISPDVSQLDDDVDAEDIVLLKTPVRRTLKRKAAVVS